NAARLSPDCYFVSGIWKRTLLDAPSISSITPRHAVSGELVIQRSNNISIRHHSQLAENRHRKHSPGILY
ncbi:hypothetical protein GBAR_LOCUS4588, partial [Geodia barretti]